MTLKEKHKKSGFSPTMNAVQYWLKVSIYYLSYVIEELTLGQYEKYLKILSSNLESLKNKVSFY